MDIWFLDLRIKFILKFLGYVNPIIINNVTKEKHIFTIKTLSAQLCFMVIGQNADDRYTHGPSDKVHIETDTLFKK